ncbi:hypothetical protein KUTeg_016340 [Tegillarca granosa]|uniref:Uncharacterized protein n=1 Tax=Tegillarca granosa TaxID=220873 RepID=A0ABQ9EKS5_TEGGR|nr:hypothetical protein KUTeg_016340 [Tegillarca granosa]
MLLFRYDLDQLDSAEKYPDLFKVQLDLAVAPKDRPRMDNSYPWEKFDSSKLSPKILFSSKEEMHETFQEFGVSEVAKRRLSRSASQSSNEYDSPKHIPKTPEKISPKPERKSPQPEKRDIPTQNGGSSAKSFFDLLHWQNDQDNEQTSEKKSFADFESSEKLLDDSNDEEDEFAMLSQERVINTNGETQKQSEKTDFFGIDSESEKQTENVDLLNLGNSKDGQGVSDLGDQIDLLQMGHEPSNFDMLSGKADFPSSDVHVNVTNSSSDSFDPFQELSQRSSKDKPAASSKTADKTSDKKSDVMFDPFGNKQGTTQGDDFFNMMDNNQVQSSNISGSKSMNEDINLLGAWDSQSVLRQTNSTSNIPRENSSSSLSGGMPRNNSGTFSTGFGMNMGAGQGNYGRSSPQTTNIFNSNMGRSSPQSNILNQQQAGSSGFGSQTAGGASSQIADPFADFGGMAQQKPHQKAPPQQPPHQQQRPPYTGGTSAGAQKSQTPPQESPQQQRPQSKPNYNISGTSVIGNRDDRGTRKPYGK